MKIILSILVVILVIAIVFISIQLGWNIRKREELIRTIGEVDIPGVVHGDSKYYYIEVEQSDGLREHLRVPRKEHYFNLDQKYTGVVLSIKRWK